MDPTDPEFRQRVRARSPRAWGSLAKKRRPYGSPPIQWDPAKVGVVRGYPKTAEAWERAHGEAARERCRRLHAEGKMTRRGVPDGWSGRREELLQVRAKARIEAKQIVKYMVEKNIIGQPEDPRAEEALEAVIEIVRAKDDEGRQYAYPVRDRISAANTVLTFTKQRPAQKTDLSVRKAEDFLNAIADEATKE